MRLRKLIKSNALHALRRHWSRAAAIALILAILSRVFVVLELLLSMIFDIPDYVDPFRTPGAFLDDLPNAAPAAVAIVGGTLLLKLILMVPLRFGAQRWYYRAGDGRSEETFAIFEYFASIRIFLRAIWLRILVLLYSLSWSLVFLLPPGAVLFFARRASGQAGTDFQNLLSTGLEAAGILLLLLMVVFLLLRLMGYYLVPFAFAESPEEGAMAAIRRSVQASRGHRCALLMFELSMLGWRILELLIIPQLFTYPYRTTAQGLYAHYLFERDRREEAERQSGPAAKETQPIQEDKKDG